MNVRISILVLLTVAVVLCAALAASAEEPRHEMRFGINGGIYPTGAVGPDAFRAIHRRLDELGMVWLRHPGRGSSWAEVEPEKGKWDWSRLDGALLENRHPWLFEVWGQVGTAYPFKGDFSRRHLAGLARDGGRKAVMDYIKAHQVDLSDAAQRADAEHYVKTFVRRYRDRVRYWEIGNEGISSPDRFEIVKCTYQWVKEVHPEARVVVTAPAGDDDTTYRKGLHTFDRLMARGMGRYFDIGNVHYYGRAGDDLDARLEKRYDEYKAILDRHAAAKPIWVTETSTSSDPRSLLSGVSSEQTQARHVVQRAVVLFGRGAEKVFWHDYRATYADNKFYQCNLVDPKTGKPKPACYTFKLLVSKLGSFRSVRRITAGTSRVYRFVNPDGSCVFVAWGRAATTIDLRGHVATPKVMLTHIVEDGGSLPERETADAGRIPISPSPLFVEER